MFCRKCGFEYDENSNYCPNCGEPKIIEEKQVAAIDSEYTKFKNFKYKYRDYNRSELKQEAKELIKDGKWFTLFIALFLISFVFWLIASTIIGFIFAGLIYICNYYVVKYLFVFKTVKFDYIYKPFTYIKDAGKFILKSLGLFLLQSAYVFVGLLIFIIPGIYFALAHSQAFFILADNPDISVSDALEESRKLMYGHKTELLLFFLSFIGHFLLVPLTLGIYSIYLIPYLETARTNYYFYLQGQKNKS